jgi:hypothetical protein
VQTGNASTAVLCVELDQDSGIRDIDTAVEILLIEQEDVEVGSGTSAPFSDRKDSCSSRRWCRTRFRNVANTRPRIVGFFSSNTVLAIADHVVQPIGTRAIGSPPPEMTGAV